MTEHAPLTAGRNKGLSRRHMLKVVSAAGVGSAVFGRALAAMGEEAGAITSGMIKKAEWVAGLQLTDADRDLMLEGVQESMADYTALRAVELDNSVPPAIGFSPVPHSPRPEVLPADDHVHPVETSASLRPARDEDLAFLPVTELGPMLRSGQITSTELTRLYLDRIEQYDPALRCVITTTRDLALEQAEKADRELRAGRYRGPLHGIPWAAKDLLAVPGYPTTWGAKPFRDQIRPETATVVSRLQEAGAVLVAKTSCGALAWGDVWFDATTKNPWDTEQGSSGSSAGSASATAAGLVGFSLGTETLGSIVSPSTRCGCTGLRPTFGRVSRHGAMALSWSMDKIGPICRSVEDCALVFHAIHGSDGRDAGVVDRPFTWPLTQDPRALRVGYVRNLFEKDRAADVEDADSQQMIREWQELDRATLKTLEEIGFQLIPMDLPATYPVSSLSFILVAEAAAAFDHLTRSGLDDTLVRQSADAWPNVFRQGQMIPAVEYLRANRIRTLVMKEMEDLMAGLDLYVSPTFAGSNLLLTNLTGHPQVVLPNGFRAGDGTPTSITFTGRLFGETELLAVARSYQEAVGLHLRHPDMQALLAAGRREDPWTPA